MRNSSRSLDKFQKLLPFINQILVAVDIDILLIKLTKKILYFYTIRAVTLAIHRKARRNRCSEFHILYRIHTTVCINFTELESTKGGGLDAALLDAAAHQVNGVLRSNNIVFLHLVDLLYKAGELLIRLNEHLLLRLLVLT